MMQFRPLQPTDLDMVCRHRTALFREAGMEVREITAMEPAFHRWLEARLADGTYRGFVVEIENKAVAAVGFMVIDWPPHPRHPSEAQRGYILNLFVEPEYRGKGIATMLMERAEDALAERGISYAVLHATPAGRYMNTEAGRRPQNYPFGCDRWIGEILQMRVGIDHPPCLRPSCAPRRFRS